MILTVELESESDDAACLHLKVTDTGIGIAPEKQRQIFEAFHQADGSTTRQFGGTGLGLSISASLVKMMAGKIWVDSAVGQGSTFHFTATFPHAPPLERKPEPNPGVLRNLTVLAVDDNLVNRRILADALRKWGMNPTIVESGKEALAAVERAVALGRPYPLAILDVQMPGMDGFELAARMHEDPGSQVTRIIMLSSTGQRGDALRCQQKGIFGYLHKPLRHAGLLEKMLSVLGEPAGDSHPEQAVELSPLHKVQCRRILVAEDNPVNQRVALRLLEKQGHRVVIAANGREAVAALDREPFDVVLMDVQMPEVDGIEATAAIREKERVSGGRVRIVAMTAHAMNGDRERFLAAGMDDCITKPIHLKALYDAIA